MANSVTVIRNRRLVWGVCVIAIVAATPRLRAQETLADLFPTFDQREAHRMAVYNRLTGDVVELEAHAAVLRQVAEVVSPSVVHIEARPRSGARGVEEAGSGVLIRRDGRDYVLTNRHVVKASLPNPESTSRFGSNDRIELHLQDRRVIFPQEIWADAFSDVAVFLVTADELSPIRIGDSTTIRRGDHILAFGSPFALDQSMTFGVVSALGRRDLQLEEDVRFQDFIQVDAAINPGNSGGPLVNLRAN